MKAVLCKAFGPPESLVIEENTNRNHLFLLSRVARLLALLKSLVRM